MGRGIGMIRLQGQRVLDSYDVPILIIANDVESDQLYVCSFVNSTEEGLVKAPNSLLHCPTIWGPYDMKLKKSLTRIDNDVYHHQHSKICISRAHLERVDRVVGDQWQWDDYHREGALCSGQIRDCSVSRWPLLRRLLS